MPTLRAIQENAVDLRADKGWPAASALERFLFLVEEVGELARVLQGRVEVPRDTAAEELFDVIWNVCDLANLLDVDLDEAAARKIERNEDRVWPVPPK